MRRLLPVIVATILATTLIALEGTAQGRAILFGQVSNPNYSTIKIKYTDNYINGTQIEVQTDLDAKGEYAIAVDIDEPTLASFIYGEKELPMFLSPDNQLMVNFDAYNFYKSMTFAGMGTNDNTFMLRYAQKFGVRDKFTETIMPPGLTVPNAIFEKMNELPPTEFEVYLNELQQAEKTFYDTYPEKKYLSYQLKHFMNALIQYKWASYRLAYTELERLVPIKIPDEYYIFLWDVKVSNDDALGQPEYGAFLDHYLKYMYKDIHQDTVKNKFQAFALKYELAERQFRDNAQEFMLGRLLVRNISRKNIPFVTAYYEKFQKLSIIDKYKKAVRDRYERALAFSDKQAAPTFSLFNERGRKVRLEQFKGKMVYMSFWASWCQPCIKEMQESVKNRSLLANHDIVFLYISVDDNREQWLHGIKQQKTKGVHVWAKGRSGQVARDYNVISLPHYFLLDKEGRFITEFKKASHPDFIYDMQQRLAAGG